MLRKSIFFETIFLCDCHLGDIKPFEHFAINGYDHIIDVLDDDETPIIDVVASRGQNELAQYLRSIRPLEVSWFNWKSDFNYFIVYVPILYRSYVKNCIK